MLPIRVDFFELSWTPFPKVMTTTEHYLQKKNMKLIRKKFFHFDSKTDFMFLGRIQPDATVSWLVLRQNVTVNVVTKIMWQMSQTQMQRGQGSWNVKNAPVRVSCIFGLRKMIRYIFGVNRINVPTNLRDFEPVFLFYWHSMDDVITVVVCKNLTIWRVRVKLNVGANTMQKCMILEDWNAWNVPVTNSIHLIDVPVEKLMINIRNMFYHVLVVTVLHAVTFSGTTIEITGDGFK